MAQRIGIAPVGEHTYRVTLQGFSAVTRHRVTVPQDLLTDVGLSPGDDERLVRASFEFLLERETAATILAAFDLEAIGGYFPEYVATMRNRLGRIPS